jgi:hypothetical protein
MLNLRRTAVPHTIATSGGLARAQLTQPVRDPPGVGAYHLGH